jgi:hypothetical protein
MQLSVRIIRLFYIFYGVSAANCLTISDRRSASWVRLRLLQWTPDRGVEDVTGCHGTSQDQKGEGTIDAFDHMVLELLLESDEMTLDEAVAEADGLVAADVED